MNRTAALIVFLGSSLAQAQTTWLTPDFKIIHTPRPLSAVQAPPDQDCRANIAKVVCLVDPAKEGDDESKRTCLPGSENYAAPFEKLYDRFPAHLQKMFCSLGRIYIEKDFYATAYAGGIVDPNGVQLGLIGIRQDFADKEFALDFWASWKEQLNFGGDPKVYSTDPTRPMIQSSFPDMFYFAVAHEFGHLFDFTNKLNRFDDCKFENGRLEGACTSAPGSWAEQSWKDARNHPLDVNEFPLRTELCFYTCNGKFIDLGRAQELYHDLFATNFISIYAAQNPMEDFADTFAYYTVRNELQATYWVTLQDGQVFDSMEHLYSGAMKGKADFIRNFLAGTIRYPGDK
jgi:hypothetical protein